MHIYEVYDRKAGYEGRERRREPWWRQTEAQKQLRAALEDILEDARTRRLESGRRGEGRRWEEVD